MHIERTALQCLLYFFFLSATEQECEWMIFKDVLHQHDSNRGNSVCSQALNELTFHEMVIDELLHVPKSF